MDGHSAHSSSSPDSHEITLESLEPDQRSWTTHHQQETIQQAETEAYASSENTTQETATYHTYYTTQQVYQTAETTDAAQVYQTVYPTPDRSSSEGNF